MNGIVSMISMIINIHKHFTIFFYIFMFNMNNYEKISIFNLNKNKLVVNIDRTMTNQYL